MRIILLGAPGCGKGSVGELVRDHFGFPRISTGDLLREAVRKKTPLGVKAESQLGKGGLVDDALVLEILRLRLENHDCRTGYILDGYPRNLSQAESLESLDGRRKEATFEIQVREETIIRRLSARRICPSCESIYNILTKKPLKEGLCDKCGAGLIQRPDDIPDVIRKRLETYRLETLPLVAYYEAKGVLHRIDGNGTIAETFSLVRNVLDGILETQSGGRAEP